MSTDPTTGRKHEESITCWCGPIISDTGVHHRDPDWAWLASTYALQRDYFGQNFDMSPESFADYVTTNYAAMTVELGEMMAEVGWKTWTTSRGWVNREAFIKEAVDAAHFLANMLCAVNCSDEEWETAYRAKQEINRKRMSSGYDGVSDKCPDCQRANDDRGPNELCWCKRS